MSCGVDEVRIPPLFLFRPPELMLRSIGQNAKETKGDSELNISYDRRHLGILLEFCELQVSRLSSIPVVLPAAVFKFADSCLSVICGA